MYAVPSRVRRRRKRPILPAAAAAASAALAEEREGAGTEEEEQEEAGRGAAAGRFHPCDLCGCLPSKHVSKVFGVHADKDCCYGVSQVFIFWHSCEG